MRIDSAADGDKVMMMMMMMAMMSMMVMKMRGDAVSGCLGCG